MIEIFYKVRLCVVQIFALVDFSELAKTTGLVTYKSFHYLFDDHSYVMVVESALIGNYLEVDESF